MRKFIGLTLIIFCATQLSAQTGTFSTVAMTGGGTTSNIRPRIALNANKNPVVTWNKTSNKIVSFAKWNGTGFTTPTTLTPTGIQADVFTWAGQEIASNKDSVYIVYASLMGTQSLVFIHKSIDGGATFSDSIRVSNIGSDKARFPTVNINGMGNPIVSFMRMDSLWEDPSYVVTNSMNGGNSFMPDVDASFNLTGFPVCDCCPASVVCKGNSQAMLYRDNATNIRDIIGTISTNNGSSFSSTIDPDNSNWNINACPSTGPDGHFGTDSLYVVYASGAVSPMQVYINAVHATTLVAGTQHLISSSTQMQNFPLIAGNKDTIGIVWEQGGKAMFSYSLNGIGNLTTAIQVNETTDVATKPDIAYANGVFHFVWSSNSGMVHYRTFDINGSTGVEDVSKANIKVYPNPSNNKWVIDISGGQNLISAINMLDINGKVIFENNSIKNQKVTIENSSWAIGTYILEIKVDNKIYSSKLIKQ